MTDDFRSLTPMLTNENSTRKVVAFTPRPPVIHVWQVTEENWDEAFEFLKKNCLRVDSDKQNGRLYYRWTSWGGGYRICLGDWIEEREYGQFRVHPKYSIEREWMPVQ